MAPIVCPACRELASSQEGACTACGVPLGEDNRCGRCLAIAAVFERTGRYVCSACGESRSHHQHTVVSSEAALLQAFEPAPNRVSPIVVGLLGALSATSVAIGLAGILPLWSTALGALGFAIAAARVWWIGRRQRERAWRRRRYEMEQRTIGLAYRNDGMLSAGLVSATLRLSLSEARELLGELVGTGRARSETNEAGDTSYYFGEAKRTRGIRARPSMSG